MLLGTAAVENEKHYAECKYRSPSQNCDRTFENVGHALIAPIRTIESPPRQQKPERGEWRSEQDLQAQWDMARWAFWSAFAALIGICVTGVGVIFVKQTLDATRQAVAEAAKGNDAARRAANAAIAAVHTERAWMMADGGTFGETENTEIDGVRHRKAFRIQARWQNSGRSPALRAGLSIAFRLLNPDEPIPTFSVADYPSRVTTIGPGRRVMTNSMGFGAADYELFLRKKKRLFVYSRIEYEDIYNPGIVRHTEVCLEVSRNGTFVDEMGVDRPYFEFISVGDQHTAS
ncbi:MAG: hypothetical protein ACK4UO_19400 [Pseudolabrys sp.]